jgi:hypothetical protein
MVFAGLVNHPRIHGALSCTVGESLALTYTAVKVTFALWLDAPSLAMTTR